MAYQPRIGKARDFGRRHEKIRPKTKRQKSRPSGSSISGEKHAPTRREILDRTLRELQNLGNQKFALPPFSEHFDRWLMNLGDLLFEFESNPAMKIDDQFVEECSQILSDVQRNLGERRLKEPLGGEVIRNLSEASKLLEPIEDEYATKTKEIESRKQREVQHLSNRVSELKENLAGIARMKTSLFKGFSRKTKARKEAEATERLNSAERELATTLRFFAVEEERLREEYQMKKQPILEEIRNRQREIENRETESKNDSSQEIRRLACEALINAINALLKRMDTCSKAREAIPHDHGIEPVRPTKHREYEE